MSEFASRRQSTTTVTVKLPTQPYVPGSLLNVIYPAKQVSPINIPQPKPIKSPVKPPLHGVEIIKKSKPPKLHDETVKLEENISKLEDELKKLLELPGIPFDATNAELAKYFSDAIARYTKALELAQQIIAYAEVIDPALLPKLTYTVQYIEGYIEFFKAMQEFFTILSQAPAEISGSVSEQIAQVKEVIKLYENALNVLSGVKPFNKDIEISLNLTRKRTEERIQELKKYLKALEDIWEADTMIQKADTIFKHLEALIQQARYMSSTSEIISFYQKIIGDLQQLINIYRRAILLLDEAKRTSPIVVLTAEHLTKQVEDDIKKVEQAIATVKTLEEFYSILAKAPEKPKTSEPDQWLNYYRRLAYLIQEGLRILEKNPELAGLVDEYENVLNQIEDAIAQLTAKR